MARTWRGERGEEWSSAQGLESILLSIQSLLSSNPYENEPGFEDANDESDKKNQKDYIQKVCCHFKLQENPSNPGRFDTRHYVSVSSNVWKATSEWAPVAPSCTVFQE